MNRLEQLDYLITTLLAENPRLKAVRIPQDPDAKRRALRSLLNQRPPRPIDAAFLRVQDALLTDEISARGIVEAYDLPASPLNPRLCLWHGDITTLRVDAIVNAANSQMLGCFVPCHRCIDNVVHSAAGLQLRQECNEQMQLQGHPDPTGSARLTGAYNLPCQYVLHTVGPITNGHPTPAQGAELASCYRACMELSAQRQLRSVAFCCISTGEFRFPKAEAAHIAVETVLDCLHTDNSIERVVFCVFTDEDAAAYRTILERA